MLMHQSVGVCPWTPATFGEVERLPAEHPLSLLSTALPVCLSVIHTHSHKQTKVKAKVDLREAVGTDEGALKVWCGVDL